MPLTAEGLASALRTALWLRISPQAREAGSDCGK